MPDKRTRTLTKQEIEGLSPSAKPFFVFDDKLTGFSVRVSPSGSMTWYVEYRPYPGGRGVRVRRMSLGSTDKMTPAEARKEAKEILAAATRGENPAQERIEKRNEMTVAELIDRYEKDGCYILRGKRQGEPMKPKTKAYTLARLRNHALPTIGRLPVSEVSPADIKKMWDAIASGRTAKDEKGDGGGRTIVRGGPGAARKVARDVSALFTFAIFDGYAKSNPCENAKISKTDNQRKRYLTLDEIGRLGRALESLEQQGVNPKALNIARLWALTGCRRDEIAGLKWSEVDLEHSCLSLEDSKTGKSQRPLAASAAALLASLPKEPDSPYVFPATTGKGHFQGTKRIWPRVIELAELPGVTPHTLRHTMGSSAVSVGETLAMTGAILGHANMRSTTRYAHVQSDPAARATERAAGPIAAALEGKPKAEGCQVLNPGRLGNDKPLGIWSGLMLERLIDACRPPPIKFDGTEKYLSLFEAVVWTGTDGEGAEEGVYMKDDWLKVASEILFRGLAGAQDGIATGINSVSVLREPIPANVWEMAVYDPPGSIVELEGHWVNLVQDGPPEMPSVLGGVMMLHGQRQLRWKSITISVENMKALVRDGKKTLSRNYPEDKVAATFLDIVAQVERGDRQRPNKVDVEVELEEKFPGLSTTIARAVYEKHKPYEWKSGPRPGSKKKARGGNS